MIPVETNSLPTPMTCAATDPCDDRPLTPSQFALPADQAIGAPPPDLNFGLDAVDECLTRTARALHETRSATDPEIQKAITAVREAIAGGRTADMLEEIARIQGNAEEHMGTAILDLGNRISLTMAPFAPYVPFAGKLIAPSAFYESFDQIHKLARLLLCPVIYAEETDAIGTASINPFAAAVLAGEIETSVFKRFGIRPFVSIARMDYESWAFLTHKHFEL
jgi:hypothetical protein